MTSRLYFSTNSLSLSYHLPCQPGLKGCIPNPYVRLTWTRRRILLERRGLPDSPARPTEARARKQGPRVHSGWSMSDEVRRPVHHHPRMIATRSVSCAVGRHAILSQWVSPTHLGHPADVDPGAHPSYPDDETQPALLVLVSERVRILPSVVPSGRKSGFGG